MAKLMQNGKQLGFSSGDANMVMYTNPDGTKTSLQNTIDKIDSITTITGGSQTSTSTEDGGLNVFTFTKSDGTTVDLNVRNGSKGSKGDKGDPGTNATTTAVATTSANGLMSSGDKTKLNGIATGATANKGTVTSVAVKMNGANKGTVTSSGTIDLGTVLTAHQSLDACVKVYGGQTNCNSFTSPGFYQGSSMVNAPTTGWVTVLVIPMGDNNASYVRQIAFAINNSYGCWSRNRSNGTWSAWVAWH